MRIRVKQLALLAVAIGCSIATFVTACKAAKASKQIIQNPCLTKTEKAVQVAGEIIEPAIFTVATIVAIKDLVNIENQKAEAARLLISEQVESKKFYRKTMAENVKRENVLYESSEVARLMAGNVCPFTAEEVDYAQDEMAFYDQLHKCWYKNKRDLVLKAEKATVKELSSHPVSVNEYYSKIGLSPLKTGNIIGWVIEDIEKNKKLFDYSIYKRDDGLIYTIVLYKVAPDIIDV